MSNKVQETDQALPCSALSKLYLFSYIFIVLTPPSFPFQRAEEMHLKAIMIKERLLGPNDFEVGLSIGHLASLYNYHMNLYTKAIPLYERSIKISELNCFISPVHAQANSQLRVPPARRSRANQQRGQSISVREMVHPSALTYDEPTLGFLCTSYPRRLVARITRNPPEPKLIIDFSG